MPFGFIPLGHVPKVRPYWRAGYVVSPSVGSLERACAYLRFLTRFHAGVMFGKRDQRRERSCVYLSTVFTGAAQQRCTSGAEGAVLPAGILAARIPLFVLQD